jgi:hypothetical protein
MIFTIHAQEKLFSRPSQLREFRFLFCKSSFDDWKSSVVDSRSSSVQGSFGHRCFINSKMKFEGLVSVRLFTFVWLVQVSRAENTFSDGNSVFDPSSDEEIIDDSIQFLFKFATVSASKVVSRNWRNWDTVG